MGKTKTIMVAISSLRTTATEEDKWLQNYEETLGDSVEVHPNYKCLQGDDIPLRLWFTSMKIDWEPQKKKLFDLLEDIRQNGVIDHIKIYRDGRINTGHKRSAILLFLGETLIRAEVVEDDYKL